MKKIIIILRQQAYTRTTCGKLKYVVIVPLSHIFFQHKEMPQISSYKINISRNAEKKTKSSYKSIEKYSKLSQSLFIFSKGQNLFVKVHVQSLLQFVS